MRATKGTVVSKKKKQGKTRRREKQVKPQRERKTNEMGGERRGARNTGSNKKKGGPNSLGVDILQKKKRGTRINPNVSVCTTPNRRVST